MTTNVENYARKKMVNTNFITFNQLNGIVSSIIYIFSGRFHNNATVISDLANMVKNLNYSNKIRYTLQDFSTEEK